MNMKNSKKLQTLRDVLADTGVELSWELKPKLTIYRFYAGPVGDDVPTEKAEGYNEAVLIARGIALAKRALKKENN